MAALQLRLAGVLEEQDALRQQREMTEKRLARAARLTDALGEEGLRWRRTAEALQACRMQSISTATSLCNLCPGKQSCILVPDKQEFLAELLLPARCPLTAAILWQPLRRKHAVQSLWQTPPHETYHYLRDAML